LVALADHREASVRTAAEQLVAAGHKALAIRCDVADESLAPRTLAPASINAMRPAAPARDRRSNSVVMLPLLTVDQPAAQDQFLQDQKPLRPKALSVAPALSNPLAASAKQRKALCKTASVA
jgi:hypothetical protein